MVKRPREKGLNTHPCIGWMQQREPGVRNEDWRFELDAKNSSSHRDVDAIEGAQGGFERETHTLV